MTTANIKKIVKILQDSEEFFQIYEADGFVFAFKELCDLTAFFAPSIRKVGPEYQIDYELGLAVVESKIDKADCFRRKIANHKYIILPMILPFEAVNETITDGHRMKRWLADRLSKDLQGFCLPSREAIEVIGKGTNPFIEKLKRVYKAEFEELIGIPLRDLQEASGTSADMA